MIFRCE